ncbi:MAG: hypothetical protein R3Y64_06155 [Peptostreptococcaceae bacterium]
MTIGGISSSDLLATASRNYEAVGETIEAIATGEGSGGGSSVMAQLSISMLDMALETQKGINLDLFA